MLTIRTRRRRNGELRAACPICGLWYAAVAEKPEGAYRFTCDRCRIVWRSPGIMGEGTLDALNRVPQAASGAHRVREILPRLWRKYFPCKGTV